MAIWASASSSYFTGVNSWFALSLLSGYVCRVKGLSLWGGTPMHISLRSHMIAGVAALGATAIAITPITQPEVASQCRCK